MIEHFQHETIYVNLSHYLSREIAEFDSPNSIMEIGSVTNHGITDINSVGFKVTQNRHGCLICKVIFQIEFLCREFLSR